MATSKGGTTEKVIKGPTETVDLSKIPTQQAALRAFQNALAADVESREFLNQAIAANQQLVLADKGIPASALVQRRAMLAQDAYRNRMNAEAGRVRAAYALQASQAGEEFMTAREALKQATDAKQIRTLVSRADSAALRTNLMVQAMEATTEAYKGAPGLPGTLTNGVPLAANAGAGFPSATSSQQNTPGRAQLFRSDTWLQRANQQFPADVRAAAGALSGMNNGTGLSAGFANAFDDSGLQTWSTTFQRHIETDAKNVARLAREKARERARGSMGATGGAIQEAERMASIDAHKGLGMLADILGPGGAEYDADAGRVQNAVDYVDVAATPFFKRRLFIGNVGIPYWMLGGAAVTAYFVWK